MHAMGPDRWIFGYGSLLWRPAFDHLERRPAYIRGYVRRFWQASTDHRGTPEAPGRVVTLVAEAGAVCWGAAYRVAGADLEQVLERLDYRERAGYRRLLAPLTFARASAPEASALVYVAGPGNPNFVGEASLEAIAEVVRRAAGPSGTNVEYVVRLAEALEAMAARDEHVAALAARLAAGPGDRHGSGRGRGRRGRPGE
jgi:glutathione-specific gamma-glutamylcyclotransferase